MKKLGIVFIAALFVSAGVKAQTAQSARSEPAWAAMTNPENMIGAARKRATETISSRPRRREDNSISQLAMLSFAADFGNVKEVEWQRLDDFTEATFTRNGRTITAFYDDDAQLVGTTTAISYSDLPSRAQSYINKHFSDFTPTQVLFYDDNEFNDTDMTLYGFPFEEGDSYFAEMTNGSEHIVLQVLPNGDVKFFTRLS